jgi:sugar lactone lactonase YvrE
MAEPQLLLNYTGHLPECPTWSAEEHALYWADILEGRSTVTICQRRNTPCSLSMRRWAVSRCEQGGFIVAMRTGIWLTDKHGLLRRKVCDNPSNPQLARFNDGGTDLGDSMRARSGGREITTAPC